MVYQTLKSFLIPILTLLFRPKVAGLRNVPQSGPVIIASNHLSFSDSIFMPLVVPRKVTFLAKSEYFTSPGIKGFIKKITFIALGQVPVDRSGGRRSEAALLTGLDLLSEGACIGIYPEGTRSPDGKLYKGRTGIARMAIESGAAIVPVAMFNTAEIQPTGQVVPKVRRVEMIFGEPLYFAGDTSDLKVLREITDEIMNAIQELSGQEYVDIYASEAKANILKARREAEKAEKQIKKVAPKPEAKPQTKKRTKE
ncbi:MAG: lysophospholipid acyltransferase family protein [Actinobacteria bacterium]|jgi:1-acyl-sn-glycerol-3-phosphate acyltransferase|nr:lysophospholipid acyltransferase family protein [Actinomycetota bacterium]